MDREKDRHRRKNDLFACEELGALLRMFSALGITVAAGIVGFFVLGMWVERKLAQAGMPHGKWIRISFLLVGLGLSLYWTYRRIGKHLDDYGPDDADKK